MVDQKKEVVKEENMGERFTNMVLAEAQGQVGRLELTPQQQNLLKHLFVGTDKSLADLEAKRLKDGVKKAPIVWANINLQKLAIDAVHRIELGLDALIPNHIHPVPYWNSKLSKYDLDLSIGYVGKDYYKRKMALDPPKNIIYELVHESDMFGPIKKDSENDVETYKLTIANPFQRGPVVGGFGYIEYQDQSKNKLVLVTKEDMDKSRKLAKTKVFWEGHERNMQMVVVVRRTTAALNVDPEKVNASYAAVELDENERVITENANQGFIDIESEPSTTVDEKPEEGDVVDAEFDEPATGTHGPDF